MLITAKLLAIVLFTYLFFLKQEGECSDKVTTAIGQGALFVTFVCTQFFQMYREARTRRWQREDAAMLARKTEQTAAALAKKTEDVATDVKTATQDALAQHEERVTQKVDEQTLELQKSMRTRVTDLGKNLEALLPESMKRRSSDGQ